MKKDNKSVGLTHMALQDAVLMHNQTDQQAVSMRHQLAAAVSGGYDFADTLHNVYQDYGYPASLEFYNFYNMFRRFGVAKRAVSAYPEQTWLDDPIVTSNNPQFNRDLAALIGAGDEEKAPSGGKGLYRRLRGLDTRQRVGRYAGLFMRVKDGKTPDKPVEGKLPGLAALVDMMPLYESQLEVIETDQDPQSDNFGQPTMYQYSSSAAGNRNEKATTNFRIHPSRLVIAAEGSDNGGVYGVPVLEAVYNDLMDLRKTLGGGAEGFYKNAAQNIVFNLKDPAAAGKNKALLDDFNTQYDDFAHNRMRRAMWTPGMEAQVLQAAMADPSGPAANSLNAIAAGVDTPVNILIGNQTGRLAGDQDTRGFLGQVQARRHDFATDLVVAAIDWLVEFGVLPATAYAVEWPDAQAPSKEQKLSNADKMADINQKAFQSAQPVPFTDNEIREEAGYDVDEDEDDETPPSEDLDA